MVPNPYNENSYKFERSAEPLQSFPKIKWYIKLGFPMTHVDSIRFVMIPHLVTSTNIILRIINVFPFSSHYTAKVLSSLNT